MNLVFLIIFFIFKINFTHGELNNDEKLNFEYDPNGYVMFCLCMGRFGNQADHFLGSMTFARQLNRTMIVPPFLTYKNVPYKEWFNFDKLKEFHRVISAEDFMKHLAPKYWPAEQRHGFCWLPDHLINEDTDCKMKNGNPSDNFWSEIGVDSFKKSIVFNFDYYDYDKWRESFPPDKYPVIALKGAPATYPIRKSDRENQKYVVWSDDVNDQVNNFIKKTFGDEKFIGIHLRNGPDWLNACKGVDGYQNYMASPQCLENTNAKLSSSICFPSKEDVLKDLEDVLINKLNKTVRNVYIATDKDPMVHDIKVYFKDKMDGLNLVHQDPWLPIIDLAILGRSEYFIGNCVSSFTSFVKRERDINGLKSAFWAFRD